MGAAGSALDLIRAVFRRENALPTPSIYFDDLTKTMLSYGGSVMGPQSDFNKYLAGNVQIDQDLMSRYADYSDMAQMPEMSAALDLYADDATQQDILSGRSIWFESEDRTVEKILDDMLKHNLRAEEDIWEVARSMVKMGNEFNEIVVLDGVGVVKLNHLVPETMRRIEDKNGVLYGYVQDNNMSFRVDTGSFLQKLKEKGMADAKQDGGMGGDGFNVFEPWEVVHFRMRGGSRRDLYGVSALEAARYAWKRLTMMEDSMVLFKLTRSPQRYAFYVDVGDVPINQARSYVNKVKNDFKKTKYIDPACLTGDTLVPCLDGQHRSMKQLAEDFKDQKFWVYSFDLKKGRVVPGLAHSPVVSGKNIKVYRVRLDSGATIRCTEDHPFLLRDGTYRQAIDLNKGDSLMPLYLNEMRGDGYLGFRDIDDGTTKLVHQMVAEEFYDEGYRAKGMHAHHINENKWDNRPENLELLNQSEHLCAHDNHSERLNKARDGYRSRMKNDPKFREEVGNRILDWREREPDQYQEAKRKCIESRLEGRAINEFHDEQIYDQIIEMLAGALKEKPYMTGRAACSWLNEQEGFLSMWRSLSEIRTDSINSAGLSYVFRRRDIKGFDAFKKEVTGDVSRKLNRDGSTKRDPSTFKKASDPEKWMSIIEIIKDIVIKDPIVCLDDLCERLNQNQEFVELWRGLSQTSVERVAPSNMPYLFKRNGFEGFGGFKSVVVGANRRRVMRRAKLVGPDARVLNHKVLSVEFDGYEDVYDLTVDEHHNFALTAGCFVHNTGKLSFRFNPLSQDEDFFIATRKGKRTSEIEVLNSPEGQQIDDVNYFLNKMFTALKIPKSYLSMDETAGHNNLMQMDVRYARTVMRFQRELKNGYQQVARVDLSARNIDPDRVDFNCKMVIPSGALEAAQMEVQGLKLDLASKYRDAQFSEYFIWSHILGMSDDEITKVRQERAKESGVQADTGEFQDKVDYDREAVDKKAIEKLSQVRDELAEGQTKLAKKVREVRGLMFEMKHAMGRGFDRMGRRNRPSGE